MDITKSRRIYLVKIADQYWATAHLNWATGLKYPACFSLNNAMELYLRAAWLTDQNFKDEASMNKELKSFSRNFESKKPHDYNTMLSKLPQVFVDAVNEDGVSGFTLMDNDAARYGEGVGLVWDDAKIVEADKFINSIRRTLNPETTDSWLDIITKLKILPQDKKMVYEGIKLMLESQ